MNLLYLVKSGESKYLVFDEMPDKISTKYGDDTIIGRIGGIFYDFLAKRKEGQVFCDMITERIEKYEKRMSYDKGKLNN